jgi:hypothetical protein
VIKLNGIDDKSAVQYNKWAFRWKRGSEVEKYYLVPDRWLKIPSQVSGVFGGYTDVEKIITKGQSRYSLPVAIGTLIGGYLEGVSLGLTLATANEQPYNLEVVYNFATFQRIVFEYGANAVSITSAASANATAYIGHVEGFVENKEKPDNYNTFIGQYGGGSKFASIGVGAKGIVGGGAGGAHFFTDGPSENPIYGNNIYITVGVGVSVGDLTPVGKAYYKPTDKKDYYIKNECKVDRDALRNDILSGKDSPHFSVGVPALTQLYRVSAAIAADIAAKNYNDRHICC